MNDEMLERIAQAIHGRYLVDHPQATGEGVRAARPWEELDVRDKQQNIDQARSFLSQLVRFGYTVVPDDAAATSSIELPNDITEQMAIIEHERWMDLKMAQGYRYGPERIDSPPDRRHPDLQHWLDLDEATRDKDRRPMQNMPTLLAQAGLRVTRHESE